MRKNVAAAHRTELNIRPGMHIFLVALLPAPGTARLRSVARRLTVADTKRQLQNPSATQDYHATRFGARTAVPDAGTHIPERVGVSMGEQTKRRAHCHIHGMVSCKYRKPEPRHRAAVRSSASHWPHVGHACVPITAATTARCARPTGSKSTMSLPCQAVITRGAPQSDP